MSNKQRVPIRWSEEEDRILRSEGTSQQVRYGTIQDWTRVAIQLPGRNNRDCRKRWSKISEKVKKGTWSAAEDRLLKQAVARFGVHWTSVAMLMQNRHADQCAKRWYHYLDPALDHLGWDETDDARLAEAVREHGRKWATIRALVFPGRSTTDIKNRHVMLERRERQALEKVAFVDTAWQQSQQSLNEQEQRAALSECTNPPPWNPSPPDMSDAFELSAQPNFGTESTPWAFPKFDPVNMAGSSICDSLIPPLSEDDPTSICASPATTNLAPGLGIATSRRDGSQDASFYSGTVAGSCFDTGGLGVVFPDQCVSLPSGVERELVEDNLQNSTMILEDLGPEIVSKVISVLLESTAPVKIRLSTTTACKVIQVQASKEGGHPSDHIGSDSHS